jgi:hypothetical protein
LAEDAFIEIKHGVAGILIRIISAPSDPTRKQLRNIVHSRAVPNVEGPLLQSLIVLP